MPARAPGFALLTGPGAGLRRPSRCAAASARRRVAALTRRAAASVQASQAQPANPWPAASSGDPHAVHGPPPGR